MIRCDHAKAPTQKLIVTKLSCCENTVGGDDSTAFFLWLLVEYAKIVNSASAEIDVKYCESTDFIGA